LVVFVVLQLVPTQRTNPPIGAHLQAPAEIEAVLRKACYDCHSHETRWPWYSYVAPVSWWVVRHVERGRGDLNFSQWPVLNAQDEAWHFHDIEQQLAERKMPLRSYTILHRNARLDDAERELLMLWSREQR
jgi:hypothetical protein